MDGCDAMCRWPIWWKCKSRGRVELKLRLSQERDKKAERTHSKRDMETLGEAEKEKRDCRSGRGVRKRYRGPQLCRAILCSAMCAVLRCCDFSSTDTPTSKTLFFLNATTLCLIDPVLLLGHFDFAKFRHFYRGPTKALCKRGHLT